MTTAVSTSESVEFRQVPPSHLTPNPDNVRASVTFSEEEAAGVREVGILVPLLVRRMPDGALVIRDGARRHALALDAKLPSVPCVITDVDAGDRPRAFVDMYVTAAHRADLSELEQAAALFGAVQGGASQAQVAKLTGAGRKKVKAAVAVGRMSPQARAAAEKAAYAWTLDEYAALAEFDEEPEAVERITEAAGRGNFEYAVTRERQARAERQAREAVRAEYAQRGITVLDQAPAGYVRLSHLRHGEEPLSAESHQCPHAIVVFEPHVFDNEVKVFHACASPTAAGHDYRHTQLAATTAPEANDESQTPRRAETVSDATAASPAQESAPSVRDTAARRRVIEGNKDYRAATEVRRRFLADLLARRTAPKPLAAFCARTLLTVPEPVRKWMGNYARPMLAELLEIENVTDAVDRLTATASGSRMTLLNFAPLAAAYEHAMSEAKIWRQPEEFDAYERDQHAAARRHAAMWLAFLQEIGYAPAPVECAIAEDAPYRAPDVDGQPGTEPAA